jgi:hypothetical protein
VRILVSAILLLAICAIPLTADQTCKPVVGHFEALVVPPGQGHCPPVPGTFCTAGRVWGGIQGNYQFVMTGASPSAAIGGVPTILSSSRERAPSFSRALISCSGRTPEVSICRRDSADSPR